MSLFGFSNKNKLGIDIGTASVKIVELSKEGGRFRLENYGIFEFEHDSKRPDEVSQLDQFITWGIKETLKAGKFKASDVVTSLPTFDTFATVISLPYLSEQDIAKAIPYEARKYIPLPLAEVVLDWSIINVIKNQGQIIPQKSENAPKPPTVEVFIAAVPKEKTKRYQNIIKQTNLNLKALELENSALIRSLIGNDLSPVAVINIGGRSTSILIVDGGFERISHNYEVGGFEITKSLARSLNVSLKRAEALKRSMGLKESDSNMITEAMSSLVDLIVFETKKTIHTYEDIKKTRVAKTIIIGGLTNMPMFVDYFSKRLGLPVSLGNPLARVVFPPQLEPLRSQLNSTFSIAIGLAMREI